MESITLGSVEELVIDVKDRIHGIAMLPGGTRYDVVRKEDDVIIVGNQLATIDGMQARCLIDTTGLGFDTGIYTLYLEFATGLEIPRLNCGDFEVNP